MTHIMVAVPSTISLGNLEYFKEIHSEKKTLLITLLKRLDPYTVFVLANYSRIIQNFNEIHFYHTSKLGYALIFLRLMIEMWKKRSPRNNIILLHIYGVVQHTKT